MAHKSMLSPMTTPRLKLTGNWQQRESRIISARVALRQSMEATTLVPLVDWTKPYNKDMVAWSLGDQPHITVLAADHAIPQQLDEACTAVVVEAPQGAWSAWAAASGSVVASAHTTTDAEHALAQKNRTTALKAPEMAPPCKVPPCSDHKLNSGVAACVNAEWISSKKKTHPGVIEYVERRRVDYEKAMQNKQAPNDGRKKTEWITSR